MKVKFGPEQKKIITVAQLPAVRQLIEFMREDTGLRDYAETAATLASDYSGMEILKAEAEIALNSRVWNQYGDETENIDIWIKVYAYHSYYGFYDIGVYLTDLWALCSDNKEEIRSHMYIRHYTAEN